MSQSPVILIAGTTCSEPGKEAEFARWYKEVHLPEVLKVQGVLGASFFETMDPDKDSPCFLAIWELENEQAAARFKNHIRQQRRKEIPDFTYGPKFDLKWFKFFRKSAG